MTRSCSKKQEKSKVGFKGPLQHTRSVHLVGLLCHGPGFPLVGESHLSPIRGNALQAPLARASFSINLHHIRAELIPIDREHLLSSLFITFQRPMRMRGVLLGAEVV